MSEKTKKPTPLSVMLGKGEKLETKTGKLYEVLPLKLKEIDEFMTDEMGIGPQLFAVMNQDERKKVDKWLKRSCIDELGVPMSFERALNEEWDLVDLKEFTKLLCDLSG